MAQKLKLLLTSDVSDLGRSGELVSVKPGYARNYLLPKQIAVIADKNTLRMQEKLQKERAVKAAEDKKQAIALVKELEKIELSIKVKVDPAGHMYGSVFHPEIIALFKEKGIELNKKNIALKKPIKQIGEIEIPIKLIEDVETSVKLTVIADVQKEVVSKKEKREAKEEKIEEKIEEKKEEEQ